MTELVCLSEPAGAQEQPGELAAPLADGLEVALGIGGSWKLGHPCPVRVTIPAEHVAEATALEIDSVDGDGVAITYRRSIAAAAVDEKRHVWLPIRIGRPQTLLTVRLLSERAVIATRVLNPAVEATQLASSQPLIVAIGSPMGVEALALQSASGAGATLAISVLGSADQLPPSARDYSACDLLLISTRDVELLRGLAPQRWEAIDDWIRGGGGCVISLGEAASELESIAGLASLLPGKLIGQGIVSNPGALELLVATTEDPLQPFPATLLEVEQGEVKLMLTDSLSRRFPWWIAYARGQGTIHVVASDLDAEALAVWKDRRVLWERLVEPYFARSLIDSVASSDDSLAEASSYLGYNDLVGQLRASLDMFEKVRVVSFGQVAAVLVGILILVGPVDYYVSVKWLQRPQRSWIFAGTVLVGVSAGLTWFYQTIRPNEILVNTAQIVDVEAATGLVDGQFWSHIYSGSARQLDVGATGPDGTALFLDWQGLPGGGLGGLTSQLNTDRGMPRYTLQVSEEAGSQLLGVGIPAAGTKCLTGSWRTNLESAGLGSSSQSSLTEMSGVDQLQGLLVNPLSVDLKDATLFYHDWYYVLNSRITPGERVVISSEQIPKDLTRRLNRQRTVDGNISITRWDPADRGQLDRLLELMMFYKAASGVNYASLAHRYQPQVDHSNLLELDMAVLIGRVDLSPVTVDVRTHDASEPNSKLAIDGGSDRVWVRIVFPVESPAR